MYVNKRREGNQLIVLHEQFCLDKMLLLCESCLIASYQITTLKFVCVITTENSSHFIFTSQLCIRTLLSLAMLKISTDLLRNNRKFDRLFCFRKRPSATQLLEHRWLDVALENPICKIRLKRYVIKKRWIKAVNTILALRRMGAHLELDLVW